LNHIQKISDGKLKIDECQLFSTTNLHLLRDSDKFNPEQDFVGFVIYWVDKKDGVNITIKTERNSDNSDVSLQQSQTEDADAPRIIVERNHRKTKRKIECGYVFAKETKNLLHFKRGCTRLEACLKYLIDEDYENKGKYITSGFEYDATTKKWKLNSIFDQRNFKSVLQAFDLQKLDNDGGLLPIPQQANENKKVLKVDASKLANFNDYLDHMDMYERLALSSILDQWSTSLFPTLVDDIPSKKFSE